MWLMEAMYGLLRQVPGEGDSTMLGASTGADRTNNRLSSAYQLSASCLDGAESPYNNRPRIEKEGTRCTVAASHVFDGVCSTEVVPAGRDFYP